ncbi:complement C3-like [Micropterus dolomieu]|uniref:complement C3-like n=1 Tax=Micropterus dolomieu TaxID=147949 RepID=UPI001E8DA961|nr:complement C3-like [Micropterus dolomieu]
MYLLHTAAQIPCVKFYHPERISGELLRLCANDECTCAEENCSMQKKEKISNDDRTTKACETKSDSKIEFVYKVRLENFTEALSTDIYTMMVEEVIKEGGYDTRQLEHEKVKSDKICDEGPQGKLRLFLSYQHCRVALDLKIGKTYLIMGMARDIHIDKEKQSYQYVLGERTWIEYWPTEAECQTAEHRPACLGMEDLVQQYTIFGCLGK